MTGEQFIEQRTPAWFAMRMGKLSASTIYEIMKRGVGRAEDSFAVSLNGYLMEKVAERVTDQRKDIHSDAMDWGTEYESSAITRYTKVTGNKVSESSFVPLPGFENWAGGSPDGMIDEIIELSDTDRKHLYWVYHAIKQRCNNKNNKAYINYGGRGISICEEWNEYINFENWCIKNNYKEGLVIDRIDNDGDYSPENCQFTTFKENNRNKRNNLLNEDIVKEIKKDICNEMRVKDLVEKYGVSKNIIIHIKKLRQWIDAGEEYNEGLAKISDLIYEKEELNDLPIREKKYRGIIECKCPYNTVIHLESVITGTIPKMWKAKYFAQMQMNMLCTGADYCDFVSYDPRVKNDNCIVIERIPIDFAYCKLLQDRLTLVIEKYKELLEKVGYVN